ncbi:transcription-repair coupling factor [Longimonas halophila]|uniref:transcription-repair coupling factor n=1 Tax=Longimonas halophila TaxID=1469170 RepID=UPI001FE3CA86|nr:transcription-repair coupling factor [Longimonas halophila]
MALSDLVRRVETAPVLSDLRPWVRTAQSSDALKIKRAAGSFSALLLHALRSDPGRPLCCVVPTEDQAAYVQSDLEHLAGSDRRIVRFPATHRTPYDTGALRDSSPLVARADVMQQLSDRFEGVVVTSVEALSERVPPASEVDHDTLAIATGDAWALDALVERLVDQGFTHTEFVEQPGDLARRGGILDVFPYSGAHPIRIEFFGDEIDSLREFDVQTQRSVSQRSEVRLVPNLERDAADRQAVAFLEHLPPDTVLATFDEDRLIEDAEALFDTAVTRYQQALDRAQDAPDDATDEADAADLPHPEDRFLTADALRQHLQQHPRLLFGTFTHGTDPAGTETLDAGGAPQPSFNSEMDVLRDRLKQNSERGLDTFILCDSHGQARRLRDLLETDIDHGRARLQVESLHEGFEHEALGLAVYTDHQIFNRYHRPSTKRRQQRTGGLSLRDIENLSPGDFVVHVDHGIGTFAGMKKITVRGKQQEAVRLNFADGDVLYVNVNALYKLNKYSGKEGHQPRLTKLGSGQWERTKERTKSKVKDIARDLIELYAKRKASNGYAFSSDTVWQQEMEASFEFEDTPDQAQAAEEVKRDMEDPVPMDRLVCGDVGFGKTEVAVRAAFKAAQDGKQVAILVPTTILAQQHYDTFKKRLGRYPVTVDMISRFRTNAEQRDILKRLKAGSLDILIGTHRLTSEDVEFNDLGLFVIDEEQRFGVKTKEALREVRASVDTLTLTATPIPRTLQFSILGARDLSIIATPPPNRQPIITEIHTFNQDLIRDAILYEQSRGGQVFFIHNRVKTINEIAEMVRGMVPGVRIGVGHGQMSGPKLERVMTNFVENKYDVLISTSIIENGLDISNANTMIINRADHFGMAALHQLRGRVGRSERKAFCYLLVPSIHSMTDDARQRLQAVEEFSDLGSGFSLAMRDLDIRGAGALLGAEQSGFIGEVGYETYHKILDDAIKELRQDEFSDVLDDEDIAPPAPDTTVDVEEDAYIPDDYLANNVERLNLYRRISDAPDEETLTDLRDEMRDRFGEPPSPVEHLLTAAELRIRAQALRLPKVVFKNERLFLYLPAKPADPYFYEQVFQPLLEQLADLDRRYVLKDDAKKDMVRAIVQDTPTLLDALVVMEELQLDKATVPAEAAA